MAATVVMVPKVVAAMMRGIFGVTVSASRLRFILRMGMSGVLMRRIAGNWSTKAI
ncbi:MAG TPA: hypothetical protein VN638_04115 [Nitrospiraceae bacterium]|nr:hypothetical protein [Nitrospiraceae bacterium]